MGMVFVKVKKGLKYVCKIVEEFVGMVFVKCMRIILIVLLIVV